MSNHTSHPAFLASAALLCLVAAAPAARAACGCPDDGHGTPQMGSSGLGQSSPATADVAPDPAWQVYQFERDGIRYLQVNDRSGVVRMAAGRIGGTFWVLPLGSDADRVALPGDPAPSGHGRSLFRSSEVEVIVYEGSPTRWRVVSTASAY